MRRGAGRVYAAEVCLPTARSSHLSSGDRFAAGMAVALKLPLVTVDGPILEWAKTHPEITCVY